MLTPEERKGLLKQIHELDEGIRSLKNHLNKLNDQKETFFKKKEEFNKEIAGLISTIKGSRQQRDKLTASVKESKEKRKELNLQARKKIEEIKGLQKEKRATERKHGLEEDPAKIKVQIDALNTRIETSAMSFEKEKGVMKEIKALKKKYDDAKKISNVWEKVHLVSKEIDQLKEKADERHKKVQVKAKTSQEMHESIINASKKIDELKKKEEAFYKKFIEKKKEFSEANEKLKIQLDEITKLNAQLGEHKQEKKKEKESKDKRKIEDKQKEVEEKIKKRQKLTTEDLLVMQSVEEKE